MAIYDIIDVPFTVTYVTISVLIVNHVGIALILKNKSDAKTEF